MGPDPNGRPAEGLTLGLVPNGRPGDLVTNIMALPQDTPWYTSPAQAVQNQQQPWLLQTSLPKDTTPTTRVPLQGLPAESAAAAANAAAAAPTVGEGHQQFSLLQTTLPKDTSPSTSLTSFLFKYNDFGRQGQGRRAQDWNLLLPVSRRPRAWNPLVPERPSRESLSLLQLTTQLLKKPLNDTVAAAVVLTSPTDATTSKRLEPRWEITGLEPVDPLRGGSVTDGLSRSKTVKRKSTTPPPTF